MTESSRPSPRAAVAAALPRIPPNAGRLFRQGIGTSPAATERGQTVNSFSMSAIIMFAAIVIMFDSIRRWLGTRKRPQPVGDLVEA